MFPSCIIPYSPHFSGENPAKGRERAAWLGQVICSRSHLIPRMEGGNRYSRRVGTWNGQDREKGKVFNSS